MSLTSVDLPDGALRHRVLGPEDGPAVVFIHGALVDSTLWQDVDRRLAGQGFRTHAPDLPLGSHRVPMPAAADLTPVGQARRILDYLEHLDLDDVTVVANDSGGAITQLALGSGDPRVGRIGRVVFTNCDTVDRFPPFPFNSMFALAQRPALAKALLAPMRVAKLRDIAGFGPLCAKPLDPTLTLGWIEPAMTDGRIRADFARFAKGIKTDQAALAEATEQLHTFTGPVLVAWAPKDRFFRIEEGRELAGRFADARVVEIPDSRTFVAHDQPERLATEIAAFVEGQRGQIGKQRSASSPNA